MSTAKRRNTKRRDHLTPSELERLLEAANDSGRHSHRNYTLILLCYGHGLRLSEVTALRWRMIDFDRKILRVKRINNGIDSVHPLSRRELTALRKLKREYPGSSYLFITDRGARVSERSVCRIVVAAGRDAGLRFHVSPRMLRHSCGYALAKAGHNIVALQHYMGYQNVRHAMRYFELPDKPFKDFWKVLDTAA